MTERLLVPNPDAFIQGLDYLYHVRSLALTPDLVDLVYDPVNRRPVCAWIGHHISSVNNYLRTCLQACHNCFHPWDQPSVQVLAAPLA
ncbi:MAG: hypothetical protein NZ772_13990, partial [Cyanobacteria bacterium]|nr:hypothetical protein [Cyanobacteriota bacterium]MDW8202490.1 hypothetical protein [Cyanobacteriota bacterium SKYGB_h_bin112]